MLEKLAKNADAKQHKKVIAHCFVAKDQDDCQRMLNSSRKLMEETKPMLCGDMSDKKADCKPKAAATSSNNSDSDDGGLSNGDYDSSEDNVSEDTEVHLPEKKKAKTSPNAQEQGSNPLLRTIRTKEDYEEFLLTNKQGRFKMCGEWKGMSHPVKHQCTDSECERVWSPSPKSCLADDYYCPSCVLHHRNNVGRFNTPRLAWTADVPNTFYVFRLVDPNSGRRLIKFGRTQHTDAWLRYPASERKQMKMELVMTLRGRLETMTRIENWWKEQQQLRAAHYAGDDATGAAKTAKLRQACGMRLSVQEFHGLTECIEPADDADLQALLQHSSDMAKTA
eukprot:TRINITY_DN3583_c0_g1_i2.p1 TRINITY_DN3583_c0_g1~~TRINITY_DN3583_c0_g1_i2.p1  ORF type:complete len:336 (+),score=81.35 TRINITY_DN3583_c0_g1_i2:572-1579(+)